MHHHGSKMLRSESNSSITQSPLGWQISNLLTVLHDPNSGMCVCTSTVLARVCSGCACVLGCVSTHGCRCRRGHHKHLLGAWFTPTHGRRRPSIPPLWLCWFVAPCMSFCCFHFNLQQPPLLLGRLFLGAGVIRLSAQRPPTQRVAPEL